MSTRSQIKVRYNNTDILIYHQHDGYPEGVGYDLCRRQKYLNTWNGSEIVNNLIKDSTDEYEISYLIHTDIDYWYEIDCDRKTIRCWNVNGYLMSDHVEIKKGAEESLDFSTPEALK